MKIKLFDVLEFLALMVALAVLVVGVLLALYVVVYVVSLAWHAGIK